MVIGAHDKNTAYLFNAFHCLTKISITLFSAASGLGLCAKNIKRLNNETTRGPDKKFSILGFTLLCSVIA